MSNENVTVVKSFYADALGKNAEEAFAKYIDPDVVWENPLPEAIPFGGTYRGIEAVGQYLGMIHERLEVEALVTDEIIAEGNRVILLGHEKSLVKSTGRTYEMDWVHAITVENGRICHVREYNDTARMLPAFA